MNMLIIQTSAAVKIIMTLYYQLTRKSVVVWVQFQD